jgi:formylglycine-generating enzyme required for sulfatase activity
VVLILVQGCKRKNPNETPKESAGAPGEVKDEAGSEMVLLEAGRFTMGDEKEIDATPHEVAVSSFYIDKYPVTQEQFKKVMAENPSRWKGDKNPVEQVRWSDAVKYCNARSLKEGLRPCYDLQTWQCNFEANGYRLPTEAEWEYACRAGSETMYFFGDGPSKLSDYGWVDENSNGKPHPVGQKKPNPWGLYDMCGNVWEWCNDFYQVDYYQQSPEENPRGPKEGETKVVRGGAWKFSADSCRSGYRYNEAPGYSDVCFGYDIYGFRCVKNNL